MNRLKRFEVIRACAVIISLCHLIASSCGDSALPLRLACSHPIYCNNTVLAAVQTSGIYNDSKTFVDQPLRASPSEVLAAFNALPVSSSPSSTQQKQQQQQQQQQQLQQQQQCWMPTVEALRGWLHRYFDEAGSDLHEWMPVDWTVDPPFLQRIRSPPLKNFGLGVHAIWKSLGRRLTPQVYELPEWHSLIPVPHPFVVPGGRFREFYYWDTYWIVRGLLVSNMYETARYMIENLLYMVDVYGFVPNGGRVYYGNRSQPPLLTLMVREYYHATRNDTLVAFALPTLQREYEFWMRERTAQIGAHTLNHYGADSNVPRPEGWLEDYETAAGMSLAEAQRLFEQIASGAETGWDFSSRWLGDRETLPTIAAASVAPVDLNCILYEVELTLGLFELSHETWATLLEKPLLSPLTSSPYFAAAQRRLLAIDELLWNEDVGLWVDYNITLGAQSPHVYASTFVSMWAGSYARSKNVKIAEAIKRLGILDFPGGLPSSLHPVPQQWDFPNCWAPSQAFAIEGLLLSDDPQMADLAYDLAQRWINSNYDGWLLTGALFEKYNATQPGLPGGGGEYTVQLGFGWSNGVALSLLDRFGDRLQDPPEIDQARRSAIDAGVQQRVRTVSGRVRQRDHEEARRRYENDVA